MATANILDVLLPKKRANPKGVGQDPTYSANNAKTVLSVPTYQDHLSDIFDNRAANDSRTLLQSLFKHDPDVSATVNAYLTVASSVEPWWVVYDQQGKIDSAGHDQLDTIVQALFTKNDYTLGFQLKPNMTAFFNELRYMALLRGGIATELVLDKTLLPTELRHIDLSTVQWQEPQAGVLQPIQVPAGSTDKIDLNIPTFFVSFYKRDPTNIYSYSPFVSAINTIAARQQVVNDLYRIMQKTGYPRMEITVLEEVLRKNAPVEQQQDETLMRPWMQDRMNEISTTVANMTPDQIFIHPDSVETGIMNEKMPAMAMDIGPIIEVLNAQNQAALKTMATIIGRGTQGINTASVEARVFSLHADSLNQPIAQIMSEILTLCLRLQGSLSRVEFGFEKVELRPDLELEPQKTMLQNRLLTLLSEGVISDDEFHIELFGHPKPSDAPVLSGTLFMRGAGASTGSETVPSSGSGGNPAGGSASPSTAGAQQSNAVARTAKPKGSGMAKSSASTRKKAA